MADCAYYPVCRGGKMIVVSDRPGDNMTYVEYVCTTKGCEATDRGKFFPGEATAPQINCWKNRKHVMLPADLAKGLGVK